MRWALALLAMTGVADAAIVSDHPDSIGVTIYHDGGTSTEALRSAGRGEGLGMIRETRAVDLPAGDSEIQFRGVAATMVPDTAALDGLPEVPVERDFDYGLLSPATLIEKSVGETVQLLTTDKKTGKAQEEPATIVSGPFGTVLKTATGYQALGCNSMPQRLVFDHLPDGLIDRPTLTVKVHVARAGRYALTLRYIATGLNWAAAYVARVNPDGHTLALSGWLTLANAGETGFANAAVDVIAGKVQTTGEDQPPQAPYAFVTPACWQRNPAWFSRATFALRMAPPPPPPMAAPMAVMQEAVTVTGSRLIEARNFGDYKQYPLGEATNVSAQQTKQIQFLEQPAVPFARIYGARADAGGFSDADVLLPATILLRTQNTVASGIGKPLPAGDVATLEGTDAMLTGRGQVDDTAVGLPLEIPAGESTTVTARLRRVAQRKFASGDHKHTRNDEEVTITNGNAQPVTFEWRQEMGIGVEIETESTRHGTLRGDALWSLVLKPGEQRVVHYTIDAPD